MTAATRLAAFDAVMYGIEQDPVLRSTIVVMMVLDREPDVGVGTARVERMTRLVPKLRQTVSGTPNSLLPPRWETDPHFNLDYHLRRYRVPDEDGTLGPALRIAEQMAEADFDRSRPLWEMALVTGLPLGQAAVIFKVHHSITDGVGGMAMAAALFELSREASLPDGPDPEVPDARDVGTAGLLMDGLQFTAERTADSVRRYTSGAVDLAGRILRDPTATITDGAMYASSAARILAPASEPMSPLMVGRTLSLHLDVLEAPLADLKASGKAVGGTLNDAFIAVVCGGIARYHERHGVFVPDVRVNMPVNLRTEGEDAAGNRWVPARFLIPTDIDDPAQRMRVLSPVLRAARSEPALPMSDFVMRRLVKLPRGLMTRVAGGLMKGTDVAATNVPGPPIPVFVAGSQVLEMIPFAPKGGAALNVALMSYNGRVFLGVNIDTGPVRDPGAMVECLREALDEVLAVGRGAGSAGSAKSRSGTKTGAKKPGEKERSAKKASAKQARRAKA